MRKFWFTLMAICYAAAAVLMLITFFRLDNLSIKQAAAALVYVYVLVGAGLFFHLLYYCKKLLDGQKLSHANQAQVLTNQVIIANTMAERLPDLNKTDEWQNWYGSLFRIVKRTYPDPANCDMYVDKLVFDGHRRQLIAAYPAGTPHPYVNTSTEEYIFWGTDLLDAPTGRLVTWSLVSFPVPRYTTTEAQFQQDLENIR